MHLLLFGGKEMVGSERVVPEYVHRNVSCNRSTGIQVKGGDKDLS